MRNFAQLRTKSHFFVPFNSVKKVSYPRLYDKNYNFYTKSGPFDIFLSVLGVEGEKFDTFKVLKQCPISSIFSLLIYWKENHGKSERVYASRRGS